MPTIVQTQKSIVTGLWGSALIRGSDGVMRPLKMGDEVVRGDVILTTQNGIVRLSHEGNDTDLATGREPTLAQKVLGTETDRVITGLEQGLPEAATAAGLTGGADGTSLGEGLRVDRIEETVTPGGIPASPVPGASAVNNAATPGENLTPAALPGNVTGNEDTTLPISLTGSDPDGTVTNVRIISVPAGGVLLSGGAVVSAGTVLTPDQAANLQFLPTANLNGNPGPITFTVTDNQGAESLPATVNLLLLPVQDAPTAANDNTSTPEDTPITLPLASLLANDSDVDGDPLTLLSVQNPVNGTVAIVGGNPVFTPTPNYFGPASFTYTISDGQGGTATATVFITVTSVNDLPVANPDSGNTLVNSQITFTPASLLANDSDPEGNPLSIISVQNPVNGAVNIVDGNPIFTPTPGFVGTGSFTYTISDGQGGTATATVTVTVTAPPPPPPPPPPAPAPPTPGLSINDVTVNEGAGTATFTVTLTPASPGVVTVNFTTGSGTATSGLDFTAVTNLLTFPAGTTTRTITVPITNDLLPEGTETFTVTLSGAVGATISDGLGIGTILDNDSGTPAVASVSSDTKVEGVALSHTVTLTGTTTAALTIPFSVAGVTASAGDFGAPTFGSGVVNNGDGTITIPVGVSSFSVSIPTVDDALSEPTETLTLTVGGVAGTGTITDNDGTPTITSVSSPSIAEGGNLLYSVVLSGAAAVATTYPFTLGGGTASGTDYGTPTFSNGVTLVAGVLTVPAGVTTFTVTLPTVNDAITEPNETVPLNIGGTTGTGTILDNDPAPTVASVSSDTKVEGIALAHTVTLTGTTTAALTIPFSVAGVTASAGDFGAPTFGSGVVNNGDGTITIPVGVSSFSVSIPTVDDALSEPTETLTLTVGGVAGVGTITDNDGTPTITSVSSPSIAEGGNLLYSVVLSGASAVATTYPFTLGGGTASGTDYGTPTFSNGVILVAGVLTVPAGVTTFTVTLPTVNDAITEPNETVPLNIGGTTGTGTILDNDPAPTVASVSSDTKVEGIALAHTVMLTGTTTAALTIPFSVAGVTASAGDFGAPTFGSGVVNNGDGTITIPVGVSSFSVSIPTVDDALTEPTETLTLTVGGIAGTGTITDNDVPTVASVSSDTKVEGVALAHTVTLSASTVAPLTIPFSVAGVTASAGDFGAPTFGSGVVNNGDGTITIPVGVSSFSVSIPTVDDALSELTETLTLTVGGVAGVGTITDNDGTPTITSVSSPSIAEGGNLLYSVVLSGASAVATTYPFTLGGGTASGTDYGTPTFSNGVILVAGVLTVPAGVTTFTVTLPTVNDAITEPNETVPLNIGGATGTGTILDNDPAPTVASVSSDTKVEGIALAHTVTLTGTTTAALTIPFSVAGVTASAGDFGAPTFGSGVVNNGDGTITIPVGVSSFSVSIPTVDDALTEPTETLTLTVGGIAGTGTITDNDVPTVASVSSDTKVEGVALAHTVTLSASTVAPLTIPFSVAGVTASAGDFGAPTFGSGVVNNGDGTITIPVGVSSFSVSIPTVDDALNELTETLTLTVGGVAGTGTITDNDAPPTLSVNDVTVNESAGNATFTVTLSAPSGQTVTVVYTTSNGTASSGSDYTTTTNTITFAPGATTATFSVPIINDTLNESNEIFNVTLSSPTNATILDGSGVGTILDNDARLFTKTTLEDTAAVFTTADFGLIGSDTGVRIDALPVAGQLLLSGVAVSAGAVVSAADISAGLLTYAPTSNGPALANTSGNNFASFNYSVRDAGNVFDLVQNTTTINVTPDADKPTVTITPASNTPVSQGLTWDFYQSVAGLDGSNAGNTTTVESVIEGNAITSSRLLTNAYLNGTNSYNFTGVPEAGGESSTTYTTEDNGHRISGYVLLQAGVDYSFSGYMDDTLRIELGGQVMFNNGFNNYGSIFTGPFTPTVTGYYSLEIINYNGAGPGGLDVNFRAGSGAAMDLSSSNFVLLQNDAAVLSVGLPTGAFVPNGGAPEGGYYPLAPTTGWTKVPTTVAFTDNDGSETHVVTVTGLPAGFEIRDGTNTATSTGGAITVTGWSLANLEVRPSIGYSGSTGMTVNATATEIGNADTETTSSSVTITVTGSAVTVLDAPLMSAFSATEGTKSMSSADVFEWRLGEPAGHGGPTVDVVNDFHVAKDSLDLRDLLVGESHLGSDLGNLGNFLHVNVVGSDTEIRISTTGGFAGGAYDSTAEDQRIVLDNVDLVASLSLNPASSNQDIITAMLNHGKLITD